MKKLKLQKALLAICLALPITIKMSNEINAVKTQQETKSQKTYKYRSSRTKNLEDTFSYQESKFLQENKDKEPITEAKYKDFLTSYIKNDPVRYLALMIQSNYNQISIQPNSFANKEEKAKWIRTLLLSCNLLGNKQTDAPTNDQQNPNTFTYDNYYNYIKEQVSDIRAAIKVLHLLQKQQNDSYMIPYDAQILILLFKQHDKDSQIQQSLDLMRQLINDLQTAAILITNTRPYKTIIDFLGEVSEQLVRESLAQNPGNNETPLAQLAQLVGKFIDVFYDKYKDRNTALFKLELFSTQARANKSEHISNYNLEGQKAHKEKQRETKDDVQDKHNDWRNKHKASTTGDKQPKNIYATYSQHLVEFLRRHDNIEKITQKQHIDFLREYINGDITKYLALMIQTKYCQLPDLGPHNATSKNIAQLHYDLLYKDQIYGQQGDPITDDSEIKEQISLLLFDINSTIKRGKRERTQAELILSLLFSKETNKSIPGALKQMRETIEAYRKEKHSIVDELYSPLISFLDLAAKQLQLESEYQEADYDINGDETTLELLALRAKQFSEAYKNKPKGNLDIKEIEKLIQYWINQKEETFKEKADKLQKLEQDIDSLEKKYNAIVKGKKVKRKQI